MSYIYLPETKNVKSFVVNVYDAVNFDIDLGDKIPEIYSKVISSEYAYQDLNSVLIPISNLKIGKTYRCRLRGIGKNDNYKEFKRYSYQVKRMIDDVDGVVLCTLGDIDIYQRLLVDLYVVVKNEVFNLKDYLLQY